MLNTTELAQQADKTQGAGLPPADVLSWIRSAYWETCIKNAAPARSGRHSRCWLDPGERGGLAL